MVSGEVVTNAISIAAGDYHGLALRSDGTVVGWGGNNIGQAIGSVSTNSDRASGVVTIDGQVLRNVVAIAAGGNHSLALCRDGTVIGWGSHVVPTGLSNIAAIATGYNYSMGVKRDGTVLLLGGGSPTSLRADSQRRESDYATIFEGLGDSRTVEGLSNAVAVAIAVDASAGSMALKRDGTVVQISDEHELNGRVLLSNALAICGGRDGLALTKDGKVLGWGAAADVPAGLTNVVAIAGGPRHNLALKRDGTVSMWGGYRVNQLAVPPGLSNVAAIAVGMNFFLAITNNTTLTANE